MKIRTLIAAITVLLMCSCTSLYHTSTAVGVDTHVYSMTVAEMQVNPTKVQKTYTWSYNPFKRISIETIKSNITAELLIQCGADVLVEPEYIVEKGGLFSGGSVTVIGYPAKYTDFHKANPGEVEIIKEVIKSNEGGKENRKKFFFF